MYCRELAGQQLDRYRQEMTAYVEKYGQEAVDAQKRKIKKRKPSSKVAQNDQSEVTKDPGNEAQADSQSLPAEITIPSPGCHCHNMQISDQCAMYNNNSCHEEFASFDQQKNPQHLFEQRTENRPLSSYSQNYFTARSDEFVSAGIEEARAFNNEVGGFSIDRNPLGCSFGTTSSQANNNVPHTCLKQDRPIRNSVPSYRIDTGLSNLAMNFVNGFSEYLSSDNESQKSGEKKENGLEYGAV